MKNDDQFLSTMKWIAIFTIALCLFLAWDADSSESWDNYLKEEVVGDKTVWYDNSILIQSPYRALDPAGVEISIYDRGPGVADYTKLTLVIEENPTPCCATFEFWNIVPHIMTNVRINAVSYTHLTLPTILRV